MAPFHDDNALMTFVETIINRHKITCFIETGTFMGDTTAWMSGRVERVWTIEIREDFHAKALARFGTGSNIEALLGSSHERLPEVLRCLTPRDVPLLFVDAHWRDEWPLRSELLTIRHTLVDRPFVLLIDDFEVPGHPNFHAMPGGGGTIGDPTYGPRTKYDPTPSSLTTFGRYLEGLPKVFPGYEGNWPGYMAVFHRLEPVIPDPRWWLA